jgi:ankyrin repeat protein
LATTSSSSSSRSTPSAPVVSLRLRAAVAAMASEAEPSGDVAARLTALVLAAASEVVGASLASDVLRLPKERPRRARRASRGWDFACHAPATLFHRLVALAAANASRDERPARASVDALDAAMAPGDVRAERVRDGGPGVDVTRVSPLGLARRRRYRDAADLADAVVEAMEPAALAELVADVRVDAGRDGVSGGEDEDDDATRREDVPGVASGTSRLPRDGVRDARGLGVLRVTTRRHLLAAAARGLLLCRACGRMFAGDKGLREHRQVKHRDAYGDAKSAVRDARARRSWRGRRRSRRMRRMRRRASVDASGGPHRGRRPRKKNASTRRKNPSWTRASAPPMSPLGSAPPPLPPGLAAARDGDLATLRRLVASGWDARSRVDRHGSGAMHWAAGGGRLDVCRYLADELGLDPRAAQPGDGRTAMHWAARNGETATCEWLWRERGADADATTRDGTPPFHWAVWRSRFETCEWLVETAGVNWRAKNAYGCNAAQWAAQSGDVAMLEWLRRLGVDFSALNANGHSAMHKAATRGHAAACRWLATRAGLGAAQMRADGDGNTPAVMARLEGFDELADELEEFARRAAEEEERRGTTRGDDEGRGATSEEGRGASDEGRATSDERLGK